MGYFWIVITAVIVYAQYPIYMYFAHGVLQPIAPIYIPGVDEKTIQGFCIVILFQMLIIVYITTCFVAFNVFFMILMFGSLAYSNLIKIDSRKLNEDLLDEAGDTVNIKARFRNILLMHLEMTT